MYGPVHTDGSDMGAFFPLIILYTVIHDNLALTCPPREYSINNICCPMCDKGSFVKAHCTSSSSSSVCVLCAEGTFVDHPNGLTECFRCKECDTGAGLIVKEKCTTTSNTVCGCKDGHYCLNEDCDVCQEQTQCQPGQYVKKPGTGQSDTVCEDCSAGSFSNKTNSDECIPWRKCSKSGFLLRKEGTLTTDSICNEEKRHRFFFIGFLLSSVIIVISVILVRKVQGPPKQEEPTSLPLSKEEQGV